MRRFLVWTILLILLGLALGVGGWWAYNHYIARFQPVSVTRNQAEIQRELDQASWLSDGSGGAPLYVITYRDDAATQRFLREEGPRLRAAGIQTRVIVFARGEREGLVESTPAERATVAELWLTRNWDLYQRWNSTPSADWTAAGIAPADGDLARSSVVEGGRDFVRRISALLGQNGLSEGFPILVWRDPQGFLKACACAEPRSWAYVRDDLGVPDRPGGSVPAPTANPDVPTDAATTNPAYPADPYGAPQPATPGQPGSAPAPGQPGQPSAGQGQTQPPPPTPNLPTNEKGEPQEDTTFY